MARSVVYRQVGSVRRTSIPRSAGSRRQQMGGLGMSFGRMLAKLTLAGESLQASRPRRKRH